jgi:type III secretion protein Q
MNAALSLPEDTHPEAYPPLRRLGSRELTPAHVQLSKKPQAATEFQKGLECALEAWKTLLPIELEVTARLLEASFTPAQALGRQCVFIVLELAAQGTHAVLELELPLATALVSMLSGEREAIQGIQELTRLEQAALGYLVLTGLGGFRGVELCERICAPRLLSIQTSRRDALEQLADERFVGVGLSVRAGTCRGGGRLLVPARSLHSALLRLPFEKSEGVAPELLAAQLAFRPLLGRTRLEADGVKGLAVGDVVLLDELVWDEGTVRGPSRLKGGRFQLDGELSSAGFTYLRAKIHPRTQEYPMSSTELTVLQGPAQLPVEVEIELTRLQLSLGDLGQLKPGGILPLRVRIADPVLLRIGDRPVARAELVEIDGEVGARILSLLAVD